MSMQTHARGGVRMLEPWRGSRPGLGVRVRIGAAFSLLALLLFSAIGVLSAIEARSQIERDAASALQQLADRLAQRLDADMAERSREVVQLASLEGLLDIELTTASWRGLLERLQRSMSHYSWIGLAGSDGVVRAATRGLLEGRDVRQRPWFELGLQRAAVGDVHEAKLLSSLLAGGAGAEPLRFVDVAAPIRRGGRTVGVLGAHLSWDWAEQRRREALALLAADRGLDIVLVDRDGSIVLGPGQFSAGPVAGPGARKWSGAATTLTWSDGQRYLTAASPSRPSGEYPGMGWTVVVRQPVSTAFAAADGLARRMWLLGAAGAVVFGVVGWWLAGRLTEPLRQVAQRARTLAQPGESVGSHDEVAQLARSLSSLIDRLKQREGELQQLNAGLEERVRQRTESLERANEDLRSFSRTVSHDMRGPLGSMSLLLRNLLAREDSVPADEDRRTVGLVAGECDRMRHMTEELLTLAMVDQRELAAAPVDSRQIVDDVLAEMATAPGGPEVSIGTLPPVSGDALLLRQVWSNLLSNAFKFSAKVPRPRIEVSSSTNEHEVVFRVADNGVGFDAQQCARLFGVFQRFHSASEFPGTGVGLSIVQRVLHRHGGRAWAESAPGCGARFYFSLPLRAAHEHQAPQPDEGLRTR